MNASSISCEINVSEEVPVEIRWNACGIDSAARGEPQWVARRTAFWCIHRVAHSGAFSAVRRAVTARLEEVTNLVSTNDWAGSAVLGTGTAGFLGAALSISTDVTDAAILWAKRTVLIQVTGAIPAWTFSAIRRTGIAVFPIFANAVSASGNTRPQTGRKVSCSGDADGEGARRLTGYTQRRARALDTHFPRDAGAIRTISFCEGGNRGVAAHGRNVVGWASDPGASLVFNASRLREQVTWRGRTHTNALGTLERRDTNEILRAFTQSRSAGFIACAHPRRVAVFITTCAGLTFEEVALTISAFWAVAAHDKRSIACTGLADIRGRTIVPVVARGGVVEREAAEFRIARVVCAWISVIAAQFNSRTDSGYTSVFLGANRFVVTVSCRCRVNAALTRGATVCGADRAVITIGWRACYTLPIETGVV